MIVGLLALCLVRNSAPCRLTVSANDLEPSTSGELPADSDLDGAS